VINALRQRHRPSVVVWYGMVPLLPPGPQSLRPGGGSWIGRRLSMLRLSPFRPRLFGDGFAIGHRLWNVPIQPLAELRCQHPGPAGSAGPARRASG
jgi:hypothetical protein